MTIGQGEGRVVAWLREEERPGRCAMVGEGQRRPAQHAGTVAWGAGTGAGGGSRGKRGRRERKREGENSKKKRVGLTDSWSLREL